MVIFIKALSSIFLLCINVNSFKFNLLIRASLLILVFADKSIVSNLFKFNNPLLVINLFLGNFNISRLTNLEISLSFKSLFKWKSIEIKFLKLNK